MRRLIPVLLAFLMVLLAVGQGTTQFGRLKKPKLPKKPKKIEQRALTTPDVVDKLSFPKEVREGLKVLTVAGKVYTVEREKITYPIVGIAQLDQFYRDAAITRGGIKVGNAFIHNATDRMRKAEQAVDEASKKFVDFATADMQTAEFKQKIQERRPEYVERLKKKGYDDKQIGDILDGKIQLTVGMASDLLDIANMMEWTGKTQAAREALHKEYRAQCLEMDKELVLSAGNLTLAGFALDVAVRTGADLISQGSDLVGQIPSIVKDEPQRVPGITKATKESLGSLKEGVDDGKRLVREAKWFGEAVKAVKSGEFRVVLHRDKVTDVGRCVHNLSDWLIFDEQGLKERIETSESDAILLREDAPDYLAALAANFYDWQILRTLMDSRLNADRQEELLKEAGISAAPEVAGDAEKLHEIVQNLSEDGMHKVAQKINARDLRDLIRVEPDGEVGDVISIGIRSYGINGLNEVMEKAQQKRSGGAE